eukprot:1227305-Heterocapsa_arctica.AAC.1
MGGMSAARSLKYSVVSSSSVLGSKGLRPGPPDHGLLSVGVVGIREMGGSPAVGGTGANPAGTGGNAGRSVGDVALATL